MQMHLEMIQALRYVKTWRPWRNLVVWKMHSKAYFCVRRRQAFWKMKHPSLVFFIFFSHETCLVSWGEKKILLVFMPGNPLRARCFQNKHPLGSASGWALQEHSDSMGITRHKNNQQQQQQNSLLLFLTLENLSFLLCPCSQDQPIDLNFSFHILLLSKFS
jgi:hypothetical protein